MKPTILQAKVSRTAVLDGSSLDISGLSSTGWVIFIKVHALTAAKKAVIEIQDSVDAFTGKEVVATAPFVGAVSTVSPVIKSFNWHDFPNARFGVASAVLRISLKSLDGGTTVDYEAWLSHPDSDT